MYGINIKPFLGLVHTDDAIALKQIAAALKVEDDLEEIPNVCCKAYSLSLRQTRTHMRARARTHIHTHVCTHTYTHSYRWLSIVGIQISQMSFATALNYLIDQMRSGEYPDGSLFMVITSPA